MAMSLNGTMSAFGGKADIDEREIDKLIEATKRATSFRGFSLANLSRKRRRPAHWRNRIRTG
jgi:hypothetical protein